MMNLCLIDCYLNRGVMCLIWEGAEPPASLVLDKLRDASLVFRLQPHARHLSWSSNFGYPTNVTT